MRKKKKENKDIRKYKQEDFEEVVKIFRETYSVEPWNEDWSQESTRQKVLDLTGSPISICYVICDEKKNIVGGLFGRRNIYIQDTELFIDEFFIAPQHQRKGYGGRLMTYVGDELKKAGYSCMILNTERDFPSESFYKRNGYRIKESNIFMYKVI